MLHSAKWASIQVLKRKLGVVGLKPAELIDRLTERFLARQGRYNIDFGGFLGYIAAKSRLVAFDLV
jgi:hypothetical protein